MIDLTKSYSEMQKASADAVFAMSTAASGADGFGVILVVYSDHQPPHFHIYENSSGPCLSRYVITKRMPRTGNDFIPLKGDARVSSKIEQRIIKFAVSKHPRFNMPGWAVLKELWAGENNGDRSFP